MDSGQPAGEIAYFCRNIDEFNRIQNSLIKCGYRWVRSGHIPINPLHRGYKYTTSKQFIIIVRQKDRILFFRGDTGYKIKKRKLTYIKKEFHKLPKMTLVYKKSDIIKQLVIMALS